MFTKGLMITNNLQIGVISTLFSKISLQIYFLKYLHILQILYYYPIDFIIRRRLIPVL